MIGDQSRTERHTAARRRVTLAGGAAGHRAASLTFHFPLACPTVCEGR